jgi:ABC-2 type transport system ATP-binding protein
MDVVVKEQVRRFLRHQVEERGRTVLLTTHDMTEVERLAERVVLINHGRIVLDGTLDEIRQRFGGGWRVHATVLGVDRVPCPEGLKILQQEGPRLVFGPERASGLGPHQALKRIIERYDVAEIAVEESDLEDVMRTAYLREAA